MPIHQERHNFSKLDVGHVPSAHLVKMLLDLSPTIIMHKNIWVNMASELAVCDFNFAKQRTIKALKPWENLKINIYILINIYF
jgi:hypothetical protein